MKVAIVGATGMIGRRLTTALLADGDEVVAISRRGQTVADAPGVAWDPAASPLDPAVLAGVDAVVNLAGASIGSGRWTDDRKRELVASRVVTTTRLVEAIGTTGPRTLINASAVGYYGEGDAPVDERTPAADDFLGALCITWEAAALAAEDHGVRVVLLRNGVVLAREAEVLKRQLLPFKLGLGGPLGGGQQWWSWIHIDDVTGLIRFALTHPELRGPVNAVAPHAVRQREFAEALGHVLGRPTVLPTPRFALKLAMGEASAIALAGQHVLPRAATEAGYVFVYPDVEPALRAELSGG
jgi:uncharacterized protein (TIGR01777 family)